MLLTWAGSAGSGMQDQMRKLKSYDAEIAELEAVMERFYRGESIEDAQKRLNALVEEHNALVEATNREIKAAQERLEEQLKPLRRLEKELDAMDKRLRRKPDRSDEAAVRAYNALVERRNAAMREVNRLNERANASIEAHNEGVRQTKAELSEREKELEAMRAGLDAKIDAYNEFRETGKDVAFFTSVNRLLARLHREKRRSGGSREWDESIARIRRIRGECGAYAIARHRRNEHGLIVIQAVLNGTEPCFFILDTGAMRTTLCPWLADALGLGDRLGEEVEIVLAGGAKIKGRECILPRITVAGRTEGNVPAAAVAVSEMGVDGLLGQSFLKRFIYTIDETQRQPLILRVREGF